MARLSMVGLGAMGSAVARALIEKGHDLTLWNRSAQKTRVLEQAGGKTATSLKQAIEASEIIVFCIHGYGATRQLLENSELAAPLRGRTVLQMSTGTPAEARAAEAWFNRQGADYLDCSIMVYPTAIGKPDSQFLCSGKLAAYEQCRPVLDALGGDIRYLGANAGAAAALDLAVVTRLVVNTVATVYGIHLCESEGISLQQFTGMYPESDRAHHLADKIESGQYDRNIAATVGTSIEVISAIRALAIDLGINSELPDFLLTLYQRAAQAGDSALDNASLIEAFRGTAPDPTPAAP